MTLEIYAGPGSLRAVVSGEFSMDEAKSEAPGPCDRDQTVK
jgi:hypothetical protein